ncbi:cytochrome c oxidase accessory protein CcoG [Aquabacterium lacunae]|uniref:Cytochrome c oxidase accessory protein CcoG n=1 Tax=Aquabacterium lacunae TaxID=2528630 RepID=A0A4Q9GYX8_9BURK|nr:cytochrome c oxidase accessory protein CcoG [Aquabacterium lacunae]TBO31200.1 cytochrome c oxidase accessory protein CcoG [Aquabacterium lacunae]
MSESRRIIPILPSELLGGVEAAHKVQARATQGRFTRWRTATLWATQLFFLVLPWLNWNGRQMVLFDIEAQRFYLGGLVLLPQDLIFLAGLLVFSAMLLFVTTTLYGRLWCGFSCPQTVYTELFMWVERRMEGDRHRRLQLDRAGWTFDKLWRRGGKQLGWVLISLATGLTFVGWFTPLRELAASAWQGQLGFWDGFWALFYGGFCYLNAGVLREKVCLHMCPYGRFQSALMDADTRIVAYDRARGEPRGSQQGGACIDCTICVQVCPTGIDIRDGLQAACIGCGVCIDACDAVMDKIGQPRGLVRMATQRTLAASGRAQPAPQAPAWHQRRVHMYLGIMGALLAALAWSLAVRPDVRVNVMRDRGVMARVLDEGAIENVYRVRLMSQTEQPLQVDLQLGGLEGAALQAPAVVLAPLEDRWVQVSVRLPAQQVARLAGQTLPLQFEVATRTSQGTSRVAEGSTFGVPR